MAASSISRNFVGVRRPRRSLRFAGDDELVRLVRAGDEAAFETVFDRHHRGILSFCRHMVSSREEAEDAVQHTFAAAYRDLVGTDKPIQLKAWLYTIARNRCLSILRARRGQVNIEDAEPATEGLAAEVQRRQDLRDMLADLSRLPEEQRAALVLAELGALSHDEIGVTLGVRKDKVKALVFQARESLASSRDARDADCEEIQEQLAVLRGGALRRSQIKRHVEVCPACASFKAEVQRQRAAMACLLPVVPSTLLRDSVMAATIGGAAGGGMLGGGGGLLAAIGAKGLGAKIATIAVVAGGATGGGLMAVDELSTAPADSGRESLAAAPEEEQSVRLVSTLRDRAKRAAAQREQDFAAARTTTSGPGGTTTASADPKSSGGSSSSSSKPGAKARRNSKGGKRKRPRKPVVAAAVPGTAQPVTGSSESPKTNAPETNTGPPAHAQNDKPKKPKGTTDKGNGVGPIKKRSSSPTVPAVVAPSKTKTKKPKKVKPRTAVPQSAPPPAAEQGKHGNGHDKAKGNGHANHGEGSADADGKPKKDKLITDIVELPPMITQDEPATPAVTPGAPAGPPPNALLPSIGPLPAVILPQLLRPPQG